MGTSNQRFKETRNLNNLESFREKLQCDIDDKKSIETRRKYGQFSTPYELACDIMSYCLSIFDKKEISFLEPTVGTGTFYSALLNKIQARNDICIERATGIEIDHEYFNIAKSIWKESDINLYNTDFTHLNPDYKYNLVVANPPYVRHQLISLNVKNSLRGKIIEELQLDLSSLAGIYCYFLLLTHKWLATGAVCSWLIPSEFMDTNYGNTIKKYLLDKVHLLRIHRYNPQSPQFKDALVSSCIVLFKNEAVEQDYEVEFTFDGTLTEPKFQKKIRRSTLSAERKWTRFPQKEERIANTDETMIGDYFTIKRGLATGDNNFFILNKKKILELGLDMTFFKPILPSPRYLKDDFVEKDCYGNPKINEQYYLLDCSLAENDIKDNYPALWSYLQSGLSSTSKKYLCRERKHWYWQESRKSTYFLCSYMGKGNCERLPIRFILNMSEAVATNSYLMLYPKENLQKLILNNPNIIFEIWNRLKSISISAIEDESRIYGGGLRKIEPRELAKVSCLGLYDLCHHS